MTACRFTASSAAIACLAGFTAAPAGGPPAPRALACDELAAISWNGFVLDEVAAIPAGDADPAHCRVRGTIDLEIRFELLLPESGHWNGRFLMGGGGGYVGSVQNQAIQYAGPESVLARGFATVGTDTGHRGSGIDASWALNRPDREVNFGFRAVHVTAVTAKTIIRLYYGRDIDYSYFLGCSRGGGQGMMSSQRYPDDFDGIVSGAPAYNWTALGALFLQTQQALYPDPADLSAPVIDDEAAEVLETAILGACDEDDGVKDGFMTDPLACDIDLASIPGLTAEQRRAAEVIYGGAYVGGEQVYPGFPFGGETDEPGWQRWITGGTPATGGIPNLHYAFGTQMHKYIIFDDPGFDYAAFEFGDHARWLEQTRRAAKILNATDTDLSGFRTAGGKLILWNGWSDPAIPATGTIEYYEGVAAGDEGVDEYLRMFMLPGVLHCAGGPGPDFVDWIAAIQAWVEEDRAPDRLVATKTGEGGGVEMQRPVCAWPAEAVYDGSGDPRREESFECVTP